MRFWFYWGLAFFAQSVYETMYNLVHHWYFQMGINIFFSVVFLAAVVIAFERLRKARITNVTTLSINGDSLKEFARSLKEVK